MGDRGLTDVCGRPPRHLRRRRRRATTEPATAAAGWRTRPKSLALGGRVADGVVLAEPATPSTVRVALEQCAAPGDLHVVAFSVLSVAADWRSAYRTVTPWLAGLLDQPTVGLRSAPYFSDLLDWYERYGAERLVDLPTDWWAGLGPIGTSRTRWHICTRWPRPGCTASGCSPPRWSRPRWIS